MLGLSPMGSATLHQEAEVAGAHVSSKKTSFLDLELLEAVDVEVVAKAEAA